MSEEKLHLKVKGRVQGVGFRWFAVDEARGLDLAGWVKNTGDGSVEVCASGTADALAKFRKAIEVGPSGAHVASVERVEDKPSAELNRPFSIVRG